MKTIVVVGTAWGDEGKGKITDFLSEKADIVARYQGGNNAGHSVSSGDKSHYFQSLPSGALSDTTINVIAGGALVDPKGLLEEIDRLNNPHLKLFISNRAHVIFPHHLEIERANEALKGKGRINTTGKGIGFAYSDKYFRIGMRMDIFTGDGFYEGLKSLIEHKNREAKMYGIKPFNVDEVYSEYKVYAERLKSMVIDTSIYLNEAIEQGKKVLFEGAQGAMLCIEHGTYPYVTSSSPTAAAVPLYTGIAPWLLEGSIGVTKAYMSREGSGPMPSLMKDEKTIKHFKTMAEYEVRTKQYRRTGWLDAVALRHAKRVGGLSYLAVTVLDVLSGLDEIYICNGYKLDGKLIDYVPSNIKDYERVEPVYIKLPGFKEDISNIKSYDELPLNAKGYLKKIEELTKTEVCIFSVGPKREQTIVVKDVF